MHTLMAREHNRIAEGLAQVNPHWDDETLFQVSTCKILIQKFMMLNVYLLVLQEARRINIAIIQHITYNEFLPILLGKEVMEKFGLLLQKDVSIYNAQSYRLRCTVLKNFLIVLLFNMFTYLLLILQTNTQSNK